MNKFEEFLNTPVNPVGVARGLYLSSLAIFIFGAIISTVSLQTVEFMTNNVATTYLSAKNPVGSISSTISAANEKVKYNNETTIMWRSANADSCTVKKNGEIFASDVNGNKSSGKIKKDTRFTIECSSKTGKSNANVILTAGKQMQKPSVKLTVYPNYIDRDSAVKITWSSKNAEKCTLMQGVNQLNTSLSGTMNSQPVGEATVIWISCSSGGGSVSSSYNVQLKN